jgi:hypothetical protein
MSSDSGHAVEARSVGKSTSSASSPAFLARPTTLFRVLARRPPSLRMFNALHDVSFTGLRGREEERRPADVS